MSVSHISRQGQLLTIAALLLLPLAAIKGADALPKFAPVGGSFTKDMSSGRDGAGTQAEGWICPSRCPGSNDTERVQEALDKHSRVYFDRSYEVRSAVIHRIGQHVEFRGHTLNAAPGYDTEPLLHIRGRELTLRDVRVNANYRSGAAVRWHSVHASKPAQDNKVFGMHITRARTGLLFGDITAPVDAPQSENAIFGLTFRAVQVCLHVNQPNGFLFIVNSVIDCNANEWNQDRTGKFDETAARALLLKQGQVEISNSELLKTATQKGYMAELGPAATLKLSNCHFESGAAGFLVSGSLWAANLSGLINNDSAPVVDVPPKTALPFCALNNCLFYRPIAVSRYSGIAAVRTAPDSTGRIGMVNCLLDGWKPAHFVSGGIQPLELNVVFRHVHDNGQVTETVLNQ
jgi:hypothetical protein